LQKLPGLQPVRIGLANGIYSEVIMFKIILLSVLFAFQSQILFAQPPSKDEQGQMIQLQSTEQRLFEVEHSIRNLQRQIDRLSSTVEQNKRGVDDIDRSVSDLKRSVDQMNNKVGNLESRYQDIERKIGR